MICLKYLLTLVYNSTVAFFGVIITHQVSRSSLSSSYHSFSFVTRNQDNTSYLTGQKRPDYFCHLKLLGHSLKRLKKFIALVYKAMETNIFGEMQNHLPSCPGYLPLTLHWNQFCGVGKVTPWLHWSHPCYSQYQGGKVKMFLLKDNGGIT